MASGVPAEGEGEDEDEDEDEGGTLALSAALLLDLSAHSAYGTGGR